MIDSSEYYSCTQSTMEKMLKLKTEPNEEEIEEILPDLPEPSVHVKSESFEVTPDNNTNCSKNQDDSGIKINNENNFLNRTLVNINGVFYFLERIPENLVQRQQTENIIPQVETRFIQKQQTEDIIPQVEEILIQKPQTEYIIPQVEESIFRRSASATCPKCAKTLKQPRNLRRHMQSCMYNCNFKCERCNYETSSGHYWLLHRKQCGEIIPIKTQKMKRNVNCLCICVTCNTSTLLYTETCSKCGSRNQWKCRICSKTFMTWKRALRHLRIMCQSDSYYHCRVCDYRHVVRYSTKRHINKSHPECRPSSDFIDQRKRPTDAHTAEYICSLCNKTFEDTLGLNMHTRMCKKYQLHSRGTCKKIKTNKDKSQTNSGSNLERKNYILAYRQFITRHCGKCNEDFQLESNGVSIKKSCIKCSSTLIYKCKKCGQLRELYDSLVKHVKATCNQEDQFKCVQCDFVTYSMSRLTEHHKKHDDISATCTNCGLFFTNSSSFKKHIRRCGLATILCCDMCPYTSTTKRSLRKHITLRHDNPPSASSNSINKLDSLLAKIPARIQPFCANCRRHQTTRRQLKSCKHCNSKLQFRCSTCNKMHSIDDPDVCEHIKNYLKLLSFECKHCSNNFSNKKKYKLHEKSCSKIKHYRCKLCSYSTRYETYFRLHGRHAHQIRYKSRRFPYKQESEKIEMEIAKVLHLCQHCSYETRTEANLQKHLEIHLENNEESNSLLHQKSNKERSNYKFDGDRKLNLQCKVVLTRLDINTI